MLQHFLKKWKDKYWYKKLRAAYSHFESNPEKAYQIALNILTKSSPDSKLEADCYEFISEYWRLQNNFKKAEFYLVKAIDIYALYPNKYDLYMLKMQLGYVYDSFHFYEKALSVYEESITLAKKEDDKRNLLSIMILKADVLVELRDFKEAKKLWKHIISLQKKNGYKEEFSISYGKLGDFYNEFRDFEKAEKAYLQALDYLKFSYDPTLTEANIYVSLIEIYRTKVSEGQVKSPNEKLENCIATIHENDVLRNNLNIRFMLLQYYIDKKEYDYAKRFMYELEQDYLAHQQYKILEYFYPATIRLFQETNDFKGGEAFFKKGIRLLERTNLWAMLWLVYDLYGTFLKHFGKSEEALQYFFKATNALEAYRLTIPDSYDRITFFDDKVQYLTHYTYISLKDKNFTLALTFLEKSKGKTLIDLLSQEQKVNILRFEEIQSHLIG